MAINKVVYGNQTLIDITDSTVNASNLAAGEVAYGADGTRIVGAGDYMSKVSNPTANDILVTDSNGQAVDSGVRIGAIPTKVSDLTNDSGYQTAANVTSSINTALANGNDPYQTESDVSDAIDAKISTVYKYKGSVATTSALPSSGQSVGDVYNVEVDSMNYAWTGTAWDPLGSTVDLSNYQEKLVSGTNIKTLYGQSLLGAGDLVTTETFSHSSFTYAANVSAASTTSLNEDAPRIVKDGNTCFMTGALVTSAALSDTAPITVATIPAACYPTVMQRIPQVDEGGNSYYLYIDIDGSVMVERYRSDTTTSIASGAWINLQATWTTK